MEQRIFETLNALPLEFESKLLKAFSKRCADLRNDIFHFGGKRHGESDTESTRELERLSLALGYLYHILVLAEIGISRGELRRFAYEGMQAYNIKKSLFDAFLIDKNTLQSSNSAPQSGT